MTERQKESQEEERESSFLCVYPSSILEDKRLNHRQAVLCMLLTSLTGGKNYCCKSDKHLSEKMHVKIRTIQNDLVNLEQCGYIKRHTTQEGMKKIRKILINFI